MPNREAGSGHRHSTVSPYHAAQYVLFSSFKDLYDTDK